MEETKAFSEDEKLENQFGKQIDGMGKTNADIIKKAQEKTQKEKEERDIAEAQRNLAKTDYIKQKTLLENRMQKAKAKANNVYTKAVCDASDSYTKGQIDSTEQDKLLRKASSERAKAYDEAETKFDEEMDKLRDENNLGYNVCRGW